MQTGGIEFELEPVPDDKNARRPADSENLGFELEQDRDLALSRRLRNEKRTERRLGKTHYCNLLRI